MGKRIVLLSDGTGNSAAKVWRSNVWRVFESLHLAGPHQIAFYDDGVGTSSFKPLAILGGAFGYGLKRNVLDLYRFLCRNYEVGDEIFAFGFSRGAFTIRVVIGLVADQGLVTYTSEAELERKIRAAYRAFRAKNFTTKTRIEKPFRFLRDLFLRILSRSPQHNPSEREVDNIRFLGLWDTVAAYGLPVEEMTRGISRYLWPLELPERKLNQKILRACHALSLDDERTTFHPLLWDESTAVPPPATPTYPVDAERISQVWFAGVHSNVGGGYPDDSLACVALTWIMEEAKACGLRFKTDPPGDPDALRRTSSAQDKDGRLYDSRSGLGGYYRYGPRDVEALCNSPARDPRDHVVVATPKIHESALDRIKANAHLYAPIAIPQTYAVVDRARTVHNPSAYETSAAATTRIGHQVGAWNVVWRRRALYFLTVLATVYLICYPLVWVVKPYSETSSRVRFVSDLIYMVGAVLPDFAGRWVKAYASNPVWFVEWAAIVAFLILFGSQLGSRITDGMRAAWSQSVNGTGGGPYRQFEVASLGFAILFVISLYLMVYSSTKQYLWVLPSRLDHFIVEYAATPLPQVLALFALIFLIPTSWIQGLRLSLPYKTGIRHLKLTVAPFVFFVFFVYAAFSLGNHYLFNIRDGAGGFCTPTADAEEPPLEKSVTLYFDLATNRCVDKADSQCPFTTKNKGAATSAMSKTEAPALCFATGIKLVRGQHYLFEIEPEKEWRFWSALSSTGGISMAGYPIAQARKGEKDVPSRPTEGFKLWKRAVLPFLFPFRRTFDRPWGSIITRYGPEGNEENFIDAEKTPTPNQKQEEILKPKRDGELFVYLNKPHLGLWGAEHWMARQIGITGVAKVKVTKKKRN